MSYSELIRNNFYNVVEVEEYFRKNEELGVGKDKVISVLNEMKDFIIYCEKDPNNLYFNKDYRQIQQMQYYYFDGIFIYFIGPIFEKDAYDEKKYDLLKLEKIYYDAYNDGVLSDIAVVWIHDKVKAFAYMLFYEKMASEEKFKAFVKIYKYSENPGKCIPKEMLLDIMNHVPQDITDKRHQSKIVDKEGYIEVIRGQGSESTDPKEAMSWTTDLKTAKFFAYRYDNDGYVVKGKVHIDDIIFIFDEEYGEDYKDPEKEILIVPGSVKDIKKIKTSKGK